MLDYLFLILQESNLFHAYHIIFARLSHIVVHILLDTIHSRKPHHLVFGAVMLLQRRTKQTVGLGMTGITLLDMLN